jgi:hypothetical protein
METEATDAVVSAKALQFLHELGVIDGHYVAGPDDDGGVQLRLPFRSDLVDGRLFAQLVLAAETWMGYSIDTSTAAMLRWYAFSKHAQSGECSEDGGGATLGRQDVWDALIPILDAHFDIFIPTEMLSVLASDGPHSPSVVSGTERELASIIDDLYENAAHMLQSNGGGGFGLTEEGVGASSSPLGETKDEDAQSVASDPGSVKSQGTMR